MDVQIKAMKASCASLTLSAELWHTPFGLSCLVVHAYQRARAHLDPKPVASEVPVGVKRLSISGQLNVLFHPVSTKPYLGKAVGFSDLWSSTGRGECWAPDFVARPFFAGVTVFFVDPPELDMDFTGAADFVDLPVLRQVVRSTILDAVRGLAVLPARIAVDLNPDDDTDEAFSPEVRQGF